MTTSKGWGSPVDHLLEDGVGSMGTPPPALEVILPTTTPTFFPFYYYFYFLLYFKLYVDVARIDMW